VPTSFLSQSTPTQLYQSSYAAGSVSFSTLGPPYSGNYNALGYNPSNNYLYAVTWGGNTLLQIDSTGAVTSLGTITGFPAAANTPTTGAFDGTAPGANYWVAPGGGSTAVYQINVASTPPAVIKTLTLSQGWQPADFSAFGGFMWGLNGTTVYRLNLSTGAVSTFPGPSGLTSGTYGAAWTFSNGNLGFSNNGTGDIYQIAVTNPSGTPTFAVVSHYTGPVAASINDGAACVAQPVDLGITKTGPAVVSPSGAITWTLTVTNNGPGNSSGFVVNDTVPSGVTNVASSSAGCKVTGNTVQCSEGALANGARFTITVTGTAPNTNGTCLTNTAGVTGNEADPNAANNSASAQTCTTPGISVVKSASITAFSAPGTPVTYSYLVTNTSVTAGQALTSVKVTDPMAGLSAITCPTTTLAPGASTTCTATYTTTQADVDRGSISNTGTAVGTPPTGPNATASSSLTIPATQMPGISLVKSASIASFSAAGTPVTYSYLVKNTGNVSLTALKVTDPMPGLLAIVCPLATLAPGASTTCAASYTTTQADVDRGSVSNTGTATATPPSGANVTSSSSVTVPATRSPAISVVKSASITRFTSPGQAVTYSYVVRNTGNVTLTSVGVTDSMPGLSVISCPTTTLAPGASTTCTAAYTTTQADVDRGSISNIGTASGTPPSGPPVTASAALSIPATQSPAIAEVKSASASTFAVRGAEVLYDYTVTNTGNVTLHSVGVTDPMPGLSSVSCPSSTLQPGASETCTATYTTGDGDVNKGSITNTGTASGTPPTGTPVTAQSSVTIPLAQMPSIGMDKSASITSFSAAGTLVTYTYMVTNTGNVVLNQIVVTDPMPGLSAITCGNGSIQPGNTTVCTATYTTTQADVDRGSITNTGTASGSPPTGTPVTHQSSVTIPAVSSPAITLVKSANITSFSAASTAVTYSYTVTNTGNVALHSVAVTDPMSGLSAINCPVSTLAPGASTTCTATYTTTQPDVDRGSINNTGTASGIPPSGPRVTAPSSLSIPAVRSPAITLLKTASPTGFSGPGVVINYSYRVTNTGNVTLTAVTVTDPHSGLSAITCPSPTLAPGVNETCTASYTTTQADVDRGSVANTGTASGLPPSGAAVTAQSSVTVPATLTPAIGLAKTASPTSVSAVGTVITYSYAVTNTGNVTLSSVHVTDPMVGLSAITCPNPSLPPQAGETCTATYTTTQADMDRGSIANTGTASGSPPSGSTVTDQSSATVPLVQGPAIALTKTADITSYAAAGTLITYSYTVTNSGNVTLHSVGVTDPLTGLSAVTCPSPTLAPKASETCTATYTTTQADVDRAVITNTGTATGTPPTGPAVTASSTLVLQAVPTPAIGLRKTASISSFSAAGTAVTYSYLLTNSGNVTLVAVGVSDPLPGLSTVTCPSATLNTGASETCTATYTTTQADVDAGGVTNTATAAGMSPTGLVVNDVSSVTVPAVQTPGIMLTKTADTPSFAAAGTIVTYHYQVTNTGNVTLDPVVVADPMPGLSAINCLVVANLAPGAFMTCTATYTTTQADVDRGSITNTGTATGTPPTGPPVDAQSTVTVAAKIDAAVGIVKSADITTFSTPGVLVHYSYLVTNIGNVDLHSVAVADPMPDLSAVNCPTTTLAPGASETCTATFTTTQADVDAGKITNTGTAVGAPPSGPNVTDHSTLTIPADPSPGLTLLKTASVPSFAKPGEEITYDYEIINTGNVTLSGVTVTDPMPGLSAITCPLLTLVPGARATCTATYTTTQQDLDRGSITNTGTATAAPQIGTPVTSTSTTTVPAALSPAIELAKVASPADFSAAGTSITYTYTVINSGNVTLHAISVTDPMSGLSAISCPDTTLAPGAEEPCTATYTTIQADVDRGQVANTAVASGTSPQGAEVTDQASETVRALQTAGINLVKSANVTSFFAAGTSITYTYVVSNTGNVTLDPVIVTDPMPGLSAIDCHGVTRLAPGASETCTALYTTTQADVNAGAIVNTGTATGTPPTGPVVTHQSTFTVPASQAPAIGLVKTANVVNFSAPGVLITYSYLVTNNGNVTLDPVVVTDPMVGLSAITCPTTTLAPGSSETCSATYTTTQADVDRGGVINTGTATGTPPTGPAVTHQSTVTVPATQAPNLTFTKSASPTSFAVVGAVTTYRYNVRNTGNVTLDPVVVTDPLPGLSAISCQATSLAVGAQETCTATYATTQADLDRGRIVNTGMVTATPPSGPALIKQSSATVTAIQLPAIGLVKTASVTSFSSAGTPITYSYAVKNNGNVTLNTVNVTDPMPGLSALTCPSSTLAAGASETCTATYTTTQGDVDRGQILNTGTATGTPPSGPSISSTASRTILAAQSPSIGLLKQSTATSFSAPNTTIPYTYEVTNTGNVTLTSVNVDDPLPGLSQVTCPGATLSPGQSEVCTASYTTTQADVDRGGVVNTATGAATPPSGPPALSDPSTFTVSSVRTPAIGLHKSADIASFFSAGTSVIYRYEVTNTGNVTLSSVGVTDPLPGLSSVTCPSVTLSPGESEACTATYTVTQADVDAGHIINTATASGTPPSGPAVTAQSTVTLSLAQTPAIGVAKSASITTFSAPGVLVTYTYTVTNSGNVTLHGVNVADPMTGLSAVVCPVSALAPGESESCTATYTTTQADVDRGGVTNTATATGTPPTGAAVTAQTNWTVPSESSPGVTLLKSANLAAFSGAGVPVTYSYRITNTGNVTLSSVHVNDALSGLSPVSCPFTTLAPNQSETCTASYTTTQEDVDRGSVTNTATASGTPPSGPPPATGPSSVTIPAAQDPAIALVKTGSIPSFSAAGTAVTYQYVITNTGNVTLTSVHVQDPLPGLSPVGCPEPSLVPGASETCTASYTTSPADVDRGSVTNTGTAIGTPPSGPPVTAQQTVTIPAIRAPAISLKKSASIASFAAAGTPVTYTYQITNAGNVTLTSVTVDDPLPGLSLISCPDSTLLPGASESCTATYSTTQSDVDRGSVANTATTTGTSPSGSTVSSISSVTIAAVQTPRIDLVKSTDVSTFAAAGTLVTYHYAVTNAGNVTLDPVVVSDPKTGLSAIDCNGVTALAPLQSETCTATYTTTQADVDAGDVTNTATATGTPPNGAAVTAVSSVTVPAVQGPAISIDKSASPTTFSAAGIVISYQYVVANSGNVTLDNVTVTDPLPGLSPIKCATTTLAPGASETCTASYTTTQADMDAGQVANTGTAAGTTGPAGETVYAESAVIVPAVQAPGITLTKSSLTPSYAVAGTVLTYDYLVTNTGNVTLNPVTVTDPMPNLSPIDCQGVTSLVPSQSVTCVATYTTTQADVDVGSVTNIGSVSGTPPLGPAVTDDSPVTVDAVQTPAIGLVKSSTPSGFSAPGVILTYDYVVTNAGNVTLHSVSLTDDRLGPVACPSPTLAPSASETCTATHTTTQADVDNGGITNTGTALGSPPSGPPVSHEFTLSVPATQSPAIAVTKSADVAGFSAPGVDITYTYVVSNAGNVTLHSVSLADDRLGAVACPSPTLAPSESETCIATYTTTQADVDNGGITNTGTASGTPPTGPPVHDQAPLTVPASQTPGIGLAKSADVSDFAAAGQLITYSFDVINTGNVTLSPIEVTDPMPGLSAIVCPLSSLAPGQSMTCTASYTTTQADVNGRGIINTGTVTGMTPSGTTVSDPATLDLPAIAMPGITLVKSSDVQSFSAPGTTIMYSYLVRNAGNVTLTSVTLTDDRLGPVACPIPTLLPSESETCTAAYTTTQADVDNGGITNTGTDTGTPPTGSPVTDSFTLTVASIETPAIGLVKSADISSFSAPGTKINYTYTVTNTGNVTVGDVHIIDPMPGLVGLTCPPDTTLAPAGVLACMASYTTTQADVDAGHVVNTATASGTTVDPTTVTSNESTVTVPATQTPGLALAKSASIPSFSAPGVKVTYSYKVTNTGNVTLDAVAVSDNKVPAVACPGPSLPPGGVETCTASYTTTQADVDHGGVSNTGTATGTSPSGTKVTAQSSATVTATSTPALTLVKSANIAGFASAGTRVTYHFVVTNTGNVTLKGVTVVDHLADVSPVTCPSTTLAPGAAQTCTATYTTTQADVTTGRVTNAATVTAADPAGAATSTISTVIIPADAPPTEAPVAPESPITPETVPVTG
jgi:uncharacterized repeat protein (TIGR01451 family)